MPHVITDRSLKDGAPRYAVAPGDREVVRSSRLGFRLKDQKALEAGFRVADAARRTLDETWQQPWGEVRSVRNHFNELRVALAETGERPRRMSLVFRVSDDGVGFRFEWPEQEHLGDFVIMDELTEFALPGDPEAWWIPAYHVRRYEYLYRRSRASSLGAVHTPRTRPTSKRPFGRPTSSGRSTSAPSTRPPTSR